MANKRLQPFMSMQISTGHKTSIYANHLARATDNALIRFSKQANLIKVIYVQAFKNTYTVATCYHIILSTVNTTCLSEISSFSQQSTEVCRFCVMSFDIINSSSLCVRVIFFSCSASSWGFPLSSEVTVESSLKEDCNLHNVQNEHHQHTKYIIRN